MTYCEIAVIISFLQMKVNKHKEEKLQMGVLTTNQILSELKKDKILITKRTFEYYQRLGFLPRPYKKVGKKGRGVYGYYDSGTVNLIWVIWKLKKKGFSLKKIREYQKIDIFQKYEKYLKKWGFSGKWDSGSIIIGSNPVIHSEEWLAGIRESLREKGRTEKEITKNVSNLINRENEIKRSNKEGFEASVLEKLNWYDIEEKIEYEVVRRICEELSGALMGICIAYKEMSQSDRAIFSGNKTITSREKAKFAIKTLSDKTHHSKVTIRVAEQIAEMSEQLNKVVTRIDELEKILANTKMYKRK